MYADHRADVAGQVPPAGRRGEVLGRVEAVRVDHEVAVAQINLGSLALVPAVEELREGALLDGVDAVVVEPGAVRRHNDVVRLKH